MFLDRELYLDRVGAVAVLERAMQDGAVPRLTCAFVSPRDAPARHADFTCHPRYARFVADEVVHAVRARLGMSPRAGNVANLICGLSLSGLQAAFTAVSHPDVFDRAVCQSGSFWWPAGRATAWPRKTGRFWLSVGEGETESDVVHPPTGLHQTVSQIAGVASAAARLRSLGATVHEHVYVGGHDPTAWQKELVPALAWLLADPPSA